MSVDAATTFPSLEHTEALGIADRALVEDLHAVLKEHGAQERFGITLLHSHFAVEADEILLEETNVSAREQVIRPVARDAVHEAGVYETAWRIVDGKPMPITMCRQNCA